MPQRISIKPVAYVSDENYVALVGAQAEIESLETGEVIYCSIIATGALYVEVPAGRYRVTLAKEGYGSKWVECQLGTENPLQFRLLSDGLLGYMWPKWVRAGEKSEIRIHSTEQCQLTLWRYGQKKEYTRMVSWFDEHGPRAVAQILPDGDFTQTGVNWNRRDTRRRIRSNSWKRPPNRDSTTCGCALRQVEPSLFPGWWPRPGRRHIWQCWRLPTPGMCITTLAGGPTTSTR